LLLFFDKIDESGEIYSWSESSQQINYTFRMVINVVSNSSVTKFPGGDFGNGIFELNVFPTVNIMSHHCLYSTIEIVVIDVQESSFSPLQMSLADTDDFVFVQFNNLIFGQALIMELLTN
jgi:hypothetical protein